MQTSLLPVSSFAFLFSFRGSTKHNVKLSLNGAVSSEHWDSVTVTARGPKCCVCRVDPLLVMMMPSQGENHNKLMETHLSLQLELSKDGKESPNE